MASELIRQLAQIRFGELTSEEAKGKAWDKYRVFWIGPFGTTENLLKSMAATLRQATPTLVLLSRALAETLAEIERTICTLQQADAARAGMAQDVAAATF
jgi:RNA-binding protein YhbY